MNSSRRSFAKGLLAAGFASGMSPLFIRAEDKADAKKLVTGKDAHKYEVYHDFVKLPDNMKFGNTHAVQETADGRIIVHHAGGTESVCIFDPDGKFMKSWGKEWNGGAHGMQLRKEADGEFLYLATTGQATVVKTDLDGKEIFKLGVPKDAKNAKGDVCYKDGKGYVPTNIAFHPTDGSFYVADGYGQQYIHRYSAKGEYMSTFGGRGGGDGQFNCCHGIFTDTRGEKPLLAVADRGNERIHYIDLDGKFVKISKPGARSYFHPCHFDQRGEFLVCPGLHGVVSIIAKDDTVYAYLCDQTNDKARGKNNWKKDDLVAGTFIAPHGACFTKAGDVLVGEWLPYGRVTKLKHVG